MIDLEEVHTFLRDRGVAAACERYPEATIREAARRHGLWLPAHALVENTSERKQRIQAERARQRKAATEARNQAVLAQRASRKETQARLRAVQKEARQHQTDAKTAQEEARQHKAAVEERQRKIVIEERQFVGVRREHWKRLDAEHTAALRAQVIGPAFQLSANLPSQTLLDLVEDLAQLPDAVYARTSVNDRDWRLALVRAVDRYSKGIIP